MCPPIYDGEGKTATRLAVGPKPVGLEEKRGHASSNLRFWTGNQGMCRQTHEFKGNRGHVVSNL